jgi:hypothetical protein
MNQSERSNDSNEPGVMPTMLRQPDNSGKSNGGHSASQETINPIDTISTASSANTGVQIGSEKFDENAATRSPSVCVICKATPSLHMSKTCIEEFHRNVMNSETVLKQHMHSGLILYLLPRRLKNSQSYTLLCVRPENQTFGDAKVIYADCQETIEELIIYVKAKNDLQESEKPGIVSLLENLATQSESLRHERLQERLMDMTEAETVWPGKIAVYLIWDFCYYCHTRRSLQHIPPETLSSDKLQITCVSVVKPYLRGSRFESDSSDRC